MPRKELVELHDHPRFPAFLRNLVTDALQALWQFGNSYGAILPRLSRSLARAAATEILDLCSGGGGPWLRLSRELGRVHPLPLRICLTDKYPNREAFEQAQLRSLPEPPPGPRTPQTPQIASIPCSVDARNVPSALAGFRTIFSSFHHFGPSEARDILSNAVASRRGIAIFEVARLSPRTMLVLCFTPLLVLLLTPFIRPFRWSRLFWTYILPVVPFVIWYDGWISCLRAYPVAELDEMIRDLDRTPHTALQPRSQAASAEATPYTWELGEERTGILPVTYLIGYPEHPPLAAAPTTISLAKETVA